MQEQRETFQLGTQETVLIRLHTHRHTHRDWERDGVRKKKKSVNWLRE